MSKIGQNAYSHSRLKLWGFQKESRKIGQNDLVGTLFKQLPQAQIMLKFKNCRAQQITNDQTIILSPENEPKLDKTSRDCLR